MDCKNARLLLEFARPGGAELDGADAAALNQHLAECPDCAAQAHEEQRADEHLARAMRDVPIPAGLSDRLLKRLTIERDAWYRRWIVRCVAAAAVLAGLCVGYLTWFNQSPAVTVDTLNRLAAWKGGLKRDEVIKAFSDDYAVAVNPPENFKYNLLKRFDLEVLPDIPNRPVPHLLFNNREEGGNRVLEAHVYVFSNRRFDLEQTMANIGTLTARGPYTPYVYYNNRELDTLYLVLYTTGIDLDKTFCKRANN